jgi:hypothetical protein
MGFEIRAELEMGFLLVRCCCRFVGINFVKYEFICLCFIPQDIEAQTTLIFSLTSADSISSMYWIKSWILSSLFSTLTINPHGLADNLMVGERLEIL